MSAVLQSSVQRALYRPLERKEAAGGAAASDDAKEVAAELKRISDGIKTYAEEAQKRHGELSSEVKSHVDKLLAEQSTLAARLSELEKKAARRGEPEGEGHKSPGRIVVDDPAIQAIMKSGHGKAHVSMKAITGLTEAAGGALVRTDRVGAINPLPQRRMTVRDLLTPGTTGSNLIEYVLELVYTNSAAVVAEAAAKPESGITFDLVSTPVVTIAHWVKASRQILSDAPQLQSYIDGKLRYGLEFVEEAELLKGSGSGGHLNGIFTQATAYSAPVVISSPTYIDVLRLALLQAELAEYPATGIVLHPSNWAQIELTKGSDGHYLFANPQALAGPTLWGRPVVTTQALSLDEFLVGAFKLGAQIFDREQASVLVSTEDQDNFIKNMVTILAEERLGLAVYRPAAFIKGDFTP